MGDPNYSIIPFSEELLKQGVHVVLAVKLFKDGDTSLGKTGKDEYR